MACKPLKYHQILETEGLRETYFSHLRVHDKEDSELKKCCSTYTYGFNGMEKDDEVKGQGNHMTTPFRQYDPRIGRWMSMDPIVHIDQSPYMAFNNNPIFFKDPSGLSGANGNGDGNGDNIDLPGGDSPGGPGMMGDGFNREMNLDHHEKNYEGPVAESNGKSLYKMFEDGESNYIHNENEHFTIGEGEYTKISQDSYYKQTVGPDYYNAIKADKGIMFKEDNGNFQVRSNQVQFTASSSEARKGAKGLLQEFTLEVGPRNSVFLDDHLITERLKDLQSVTDVTNYLYEKYDCKLSAGDAVTDYKVEWGITDALLVYDKAQQFLGAYSISAFVSSDGKRIIYLISDTKNKHSYYGHMASSHERGEGTEDWGPGETSRFGTTYQYYMWSVPIK